MFDSGISAYVHAKATVMVHFPIDKHGKADISCHQCEFFRRQSSTCALNGKICQYPQNYVGADCPLEPIE